MDRRQVWFGQAMPTQVHSSHCRRDSQRHTRSGRIRELPGVRFGINQPLLIEPVRSCTYILTPFTSFLRLDHPILSVSFTASTFPSRKPFQACPPRSSTRSRRGRRRTPSSPKSPSLPACSTRPSPSTRTVFRQRFSPPGLRHRLRKPESDVFHVPLPHFRRMHSLLSLCITSSLVSLGPSAFLGLVLIVHFYLSHGNSFPCLSFWVVVFLVPFSLTSPSSPILGSKVHPLCMIMYSDINLFFLPTRC